MKISTSDGMALSDHIDALLARIIHKHKLPWNPHEIWERAWPPGFSAAYHAVLAEAPSLACGAESFSYEPTASVPISVGDELYALILRGPYTHQIHGRYRGFIITTPHWPLLLSQVCPDATEVDTFALWIRTCQDVYDEVTSAKRVLDSVIEMASTVGQLQRMVPDLVRFLPARYNVAAKTQARRSSLPYGWAGMDRQLVRDAINTLTKAHLLSNAPHGVTWSVHDIQDVSWAYRIGPRDSEYFTRAGGWVIAPPKMEES